MPHLFELFRVPPAIDDDSDISDVRKYICAVMLKIQLWCEFNIHCNRASLYGALWYLDLQ